MHHSKVIATGIICIALVGSVLIVNNKEYIFGNSSTNNSAITVGTVSTSPIQSGDWKKSLINISSATSSTVQIIASKNQTDTTADDNSMTAKVSKTFFSYYLADQKNGVAIDNTEATNIANQTLATLNSLPGPGEYGIHDINITQNSNQQDLVIWAQNLANAIQKNFSKNKTNELNILSNAVKTKNESDLVQLDPIIKSYKGAVSDILSISVPQKALPYHLVYLNTINSMLYDIQGMRQILSDPVLGYMAFSSYQRDTITLKVIIQKMDTAFGQ